MEFPSPGNLQYLNISFHPESGRKVKISKLFEEQVPNNFNSKKLKHFVLAQVDISVYVSALATVMPYVSCSGFFMPSLSPIGHAPWLNYICYDARWSFPVIDSYGTPMIYCNGSAAEKDCHASWEM